MGLVKTLVSKSFARPFIYSIIITSLTACGGGGGSTTPVIPEDDGPVVIYVDDNPLVPVQYAPFGTSTIAGTLEQQSVTNATVAWDAGFKGQGITIGVVDSGVNPNHIEFYDDNGISRINWTDARSIEYNLASDTLIYTNDYRDIDNPDYHGTHVSSIALGREYGVAPEATLLPVNVFLDNSTAYNIAIYEAVDYIASKAPIVNSSISGMVNLSTLGGANSELNDYLTTLTNNTTALVVAAGNEGNAVGAEHFIHYNSAQNLAIQPGIENQVLSVIALDDSGSLASFSNYPGSCSDVTGTPDIACDGTVMSAIQNSFISVPGVTIEAAYGGDTTSTIEYSGTSMATPIVSGGLALLLSSWDQLTIQQAVQILKDTANDTGAYADASLYGVGLMDIAAALTPVGDLKSSALSSTTTSYTLGESSVSIPASLSGLASLAGLKNVAFFDDYSREFLVDITPAIQIEQTPLDWNAFWSNSQPYQINQIELGDYRLSMSFDNLKSSSPLKNFSLQNDRSRFDYMQNSSDDLMQSQLNPLMNLFYSSNQKEFGNTLAMQQALGANLSLFSSMQEQDKNFAKVVNNQNDILAQVQTIGLSYQPSKNWSVALSTQLRKEQDGLMGLQGSGTFSFGESNLSQINSLAVQYSQNGTRIYSQLQQGELLNSQHAAGSYIQVDKAQIGQFKVGIMHKTSAQSAWGLQAYNYNPLIDSELRLTVPTGMSANGEIESQTFSYQQKGSLQPDTIELFYKKGLNNTLQYQFNAIKSPEDSGFGLRLSRIF
ncbi:hypothetical protein THMIRHAM_14360 [Thiomicrorhabdus immobilis]|uniref:Peptidase S8/S53 domain-containing protein n=1 Tax=Thiomicrorhabdus immobilis TaxID=2791037 RepID=A0ABN6CX74_9GAMM|nr:S8 family peptidase [Thiomicrorhabdus immobilis]BCN93651.1 hypothetical protein THMIRHAM_14360 [Thiomicrorhabdus immobilis]